MTAGRWTFTATCPRCDTPLEHVTASRAAPVLNVESRAVARCGTCNESWLLTLTLSSNGAACKADKSIRRTIRRESELLARGRVG